MASFEAIVKAVNSLNADWNANNNVTIGLAEGSEDIRLINLDAGYKSGYAVSYTENGEDRIAVFDDEAKASGFADATSGAINLGKRWIADTEGDKIAGQGDDRVVYKKTNITLQTDGDLHISAADGLSTGDLLAIKTSGENTSTKDQGLQVPADKLEQILAALVRKAGQ